MNIRNTIQRDMVVRVVNTLKNHPTAEEVYAYIKKDYPNIGKGTVYRNLNILAEEGEIRKIELPKGPDRFDHNCSSHYHVQCVHCNKIYDVDMDIISDLHNKIRDKRGIIFLDHDIIFKGICQEC